MPQCQATFLAGGPAHERWDSKVIIKVIKHLQATHPKPKRMAQSSTRHTHTPNIHLNCSCRSYLFVELYVCVKISLLTCCSAFRSACQAFPLKILERLASSKIYHQSWILGKTSPHLAFPRITQVIGSLCALVVCFLFLGFFLGFLGNFGTFSFLASWAKQPGRTLL